MERTIELTVKSCLVDEDPDIRHLVVKLATGKEQNFYLRRVTDRERSLARQQASTGQSVMTFEATAGALEQMAGKLSKRVEELSQKEVAQAAREYGKQGMTSALDVERYQTLLVLYALGGRKVLGSGELGSDREGWDLSDKDGNAVKLTLENLHDRLNPDVLDALQGIVAEAASVSEASEGN